jgi:formylglycine-generating enzyme required for sulfatase activity
VLIDACRDGVLATSSVRSLTPTRVTVPDGVSALFSCGPGEKALETGFDVGEAERRIHGVFFFHVIEGLAGKARNPDGTINWDDLSSHVRRRVPAFVEKAGRKVPQRPHGINNAKLEAVLVHSADGPAEKIVKEDKETTNSIGLRLVRLDAGSFLMGSPDSDPDADSDEKPRHKVTLRQGFSIGKYPVTVGQFRRFAEDEGYRSEAEKDGRGGSGFNPATRRLDGRKPGYTWKTPGWKQTDEHPVVNVSWADAVAFCRWLSRKERRNYALPTEAEWEYACRAGTTTRYYSGDEPSSLRGVANLADRAMGAAIQFENPKAWTLVPWDDGFPFTSPVGKFRPNAWGLHDMHGNVWQWCWDRKRTYDKADQEDPQGGKTGLRVLRGGSWGSHARLCRSAYRIGDGEDLRLRHVGFRVVVVAAPRVP